MRKLFVAVAALGMLLTSCAKDESSAGGNAAVVSFNIAQPTIASRVLGTQDATEVFGKGFAAEDLQYAIYEAEVDADGVYTIRNNGQEPIEAVKADFFQGQELENTLDNIRLVRGKHYTAIFFAQSDAVNGNYKFDSATKSISLKNPASLKAQDESLDAFFARVDFAIDANSSVQTVNVELKRPFAQVNVLTDDAVEAKAAGLDVYQSSIVVEGVYTSMNLLDGKVDGETTLTYDMAEVGNKYMTVNGTSYDLLSMNYLLVNKRKTVDITFKYNEDATVAGNDNTVFETKFDMVPVERNYRTNIIGSILTSAINFKVVINPIFDDAHGYDPSKSAEELLVEAAVKGGTYTLGSDVQLTSTLVVDKNFTLDLNGKTITNSVAMRSAAPSTDVIVVKEGAKLTIEGDGVVEAVSGNDGYAVIAEGEVVIKGGTFKAGVDADGAANAVIYARGNGKVYVEGGYFPNDANSTFVLNKKDADRATTTIAVKGGQFVNFNPANNAAENAGTNFMAYGYTTESEVVDGKTVYTVVEIEVTPLATPVVEAAVEGQVVTLTWKAVEGAAKYAVTVGEETVEVEATTYEFTGDWDTEYTFSVKAIAADAEWHTDSAAAEVKATTEAEPEATPLAKPEVTVAVEGNVVTLTWNAVEGAKEYTVQVDDDVEEVVTETTYEFTGDWEVEYTFTVKAIAADAAVNTNSEAAVVTATTEAKPVVEDKVLTVAEFKALPDNENDADQTLYTLKGTITSVENTEYGNFWLMDDTGSVLIYGLNSPEGEAKYWAASGAKVGDDIVVKTIRSQYGNSPQGKNALFVELVSPGTRAFWSFGATAASFTAAGGEKTIAVEAYNIKSEVKVASNNTQFSGSYADGVLTIVAKENTAATSVEGVITVTCGALSQEISVSQLAASSGDQNMVEAEVSFKDKANRTSYSTSQQIWEQNGIKVTNDKGSSTSNVGDYANPGRFYKSSKVTIEAPGAIVSIAVDCKGLDAKYVTPWGTAENGIVTIKCDGTSNTYSINTLSAQARAYSITVTYLE